MVNAARQSLDSAFPVPVSCSSDCGLETLGQQSSAIETSFTAMNFRARNSRLERPRLSQCHDLRIDHMWRCQSGTLCEALYDRCLEMFSGTACDVLGLGRNTEGRIHFSEQHGSGHLASGLTAQACRHQQTSWGAFLAQPLLSLRFNDQTTSSLSACLRNDA